MTQPTPNTIAYKKSRLPVIGLVISLFFYCTWVYSCFVWIGMRGSAWGAEILHGAFKVSWYPTNGSYHFDWYNIPNLQPGMIARHLFPFATTGLFPPANIGEICLPLWIPLLICVALTLLFWVLFSDVSMRRLLHWIRITLSITLVVLVLCHVLLWPMGFFRSAPSAWTSRLYSSFIFFTPWSAAFFSTMWIRRNRPRLAGQCLSCGYDLTGNVSGVCPECGTQIAEKHPSISP
jgi:hypothetical protein